MKSPIPAPSVGMDAMKTKFDPVKKPRNPSLGGLKLKNGGVVKKPKKAGRGR